MGEEGKRGPRGDAGAIGSQGPPGERVSAILLLWHCKIFSQAYIMIYRCVFLCLLYFFILYTNFSRELQVTVAFQGLMACQVKRLETYQIVISQLAFLQRQCSVDIYIPHIFCL